MQRLHACKKKKHDVPGIEAYVVYKDVSAYCCCFTFEMIILQSIIRTLAMSLKSRFEQYPPSCCCNFPGAWRHCFVTGNCQQQKFVVLNVKYQLICCRQLWTCRTCPNRPGWNVALRFWASADVYLFRWTIRSTFTGVTDVRVVATAVGIGLGRKQPSACKHDLTLCWLLPKLSRRINVWRATSGGLQQDGLQGRLR